MEQRHIPVLVEEVISLLGCAPHRIYVDATLGGGGHALEILKRTEPDGRLIGIEWDEEAIAEARKVLGPFGERVRIFRENFAHLSGSLEEDWNRSGRWDPARFGSLLHPARRTGERVQFQR